MPEVASELVAELPETLPTLSLQDPNLLQPLIPSVTYEKYTCFISALMLDFTYSAGLVAPTITIRGGCVYSAMV